MIRIEIVYKVMIHHGLQKRCAEGDFLSQQSPSPMAGDSESRAGGCWEVKTMDSDGVSKKGMI